MPRTARSMATTSPARTRLTATRGGVPVGVGQLTPAKIGESGSLATLAGLEEAGVAATEALAQSTEDQRQPRRASARRWIRSSEESHALVGATTTSTGRDKSPDQRFRVPPAGLEPRPTA